MPSENIIRFNSDTKHRKQWFTGLSFSHPAKMALPLQLWLIENFTKEGETILDPMAGSGTLLVACSMGRNVITVELESKFCEMQKGNWQKIQQRGCQLGYKMGTATILQGDARNLTGILADKIITSPPYEGIEARDRSKESWWDEEREKKMSGGSAKIAKGYQVDKVISSPPYEQSLDRWAGDNRNKLMEDKRLHAMPKQVDAVISSPPYEAAVTGKDGIDWAKGTRGKAEGNKPRDRSKEPAFNHSSIGGAGFRYSETKDNIGNLKSTSYLEAMLQVYAQCYSVLKPGGLMILVVKNFIRNKKQIRLDLDTIKLCEQIGFTFQDRWYRELASQSFWRTIYHQRYPDVEPIKYEDVLIFVKEE